MNISFYNANFNRHINVRTLSVDDLKNKTNIAGVDKAELAKSYVCTPTTNGSFDAVLGNATVSLEQTVHLLIEPTDSNKKIISNIKPIVIMYNH